MMKLGICFTEVITTAAAKVGRAPIGANLRTLSGKKILWVGGFNNAIPNMLWEQRLKLTLMGRAPWPARDAFVPLLEAGRRVPMRQPHETLRDRTHLSQAHTPYDELFTWCGKMIRLGKIR